MKKLLVLALLLGTLEAISQNYQLITGTPFTGIANSDVAYTDIDGDNDQDILIIGGANSSRIAELYTNDGTGTYSLVTGTPFSGVWAGEVKFADVDGDNDQDVLITGENSSNVATARLYINDGSGNFSLQTGSPFTGESNSSVAFADVDGDSDLDVMIMGSGTNTAKLYTNDGNGNFTLVAGTPFPGLNNGSISFGDVDGDNDQDVLITGINISNTYYSRLYINNGSGVFTYQSGPFYAAGYSSSAMADIDGDNDLDIVIAGKFVYNSSNKYTTIYKNDGNGTFTVFSSSMLTGVDNSSIDFGDVDNDNDLDVLITGQTKTAVSTSKLYLNNGSGSFTNLVGVPFDQVYGGESILLDINDDNDLDVLITGFSSTRISKLYELICFPTNKIDTIVTCGSYTWIDNVTYTSNNNTATHTLVGGNSNGCDSVVTLNLTINNSTTGTDVQTACGSYTWIDNVTYTSSNNTATHTLVGGNSNGCDSVVTLNLTINNSTTGTDVQTACGSYTWIDNVTYTSSNNTATHTLVGGNSNGCDSVVTLNLTINSINNTVTTSGSSITANETGATYKWLDCNNSYSIISGETNQTYTPLINGDYAVEIAKNNCLDTSVCTTIITVGISSIHREELTFYPNPTRSHLTIANLQSNIINVTILDVTGKVVKSITPNTNTIDVSNLISGVYFIKIQTEEGVFNNKFIKE
jgi:hypothetical protein